MSELRVDSIISTQEGGSVALAGIASEAVKLQTSRKIALEGDIIGEAFFDGTSNVSIAATIQSNSITLGGDTTGNYVATIADSGLSDIVVNNSGVETADITLGLTATGVSSGSYGSSSIVPIITVDSRGRITGVGTTSISSSTATKLETARTISLTGDVVGSVSFDGTSNVSIAATIQPNSVSLGTDTDGNYIATIADSGSSDISVSGSGSETAAVTLGLTTTGVSSGSYGSSSAIPTFTVDSRGRVTVAGTASIGTATSTTNIPNLTGDVTSVNTSTTLASVNNDVGTFGSSTAIPSITVNAKGLVTGVTTNAITVGDGTLTLATSGTGLSGSQTFSANQSGNATFTVTSNATSDNTNSTIVARNGSGGFSAGIVTATEFSTGSGTLGISTNTISGPATIIIDPAAVGDNTGTVVIKGDLQIDGTTTTVNSTTVTVDDKNITLASGAINDAAADGGGITIESGDGNKTWNWVDSTDSWTSSENINVLTGKTYKIAGTDVLTSSTLGSGIVNSSLTSVGTLGNLNVSGVTTSQNGFVGNLTGTASSTTNIPNLTGDVTSVNTTTTLATVNNDVGTYGSSTAIPRITVNAKGLVTGVTTNAITVGDGTLTLNVSGTGLSGSQTFSANQSGNATFTVTSNATSNNTNSTIVARDASGDFSAGTITATLSGNSSSATYATSAGISTSVIGGIGSITSLDVSGITTTSTLNVGTGGTVITTTSDGLVGIGTTNPQTKLQIGGVLGFTDDNVKIGDNTTGQSITTGDQNNFIGPSAGQYTTSGSNNNFFGPSAGRENISGGYNNFIGAAAGLNNISGYGNNFFGIYAGYANTTGSYNICIGDGSGWNSKTDHNLSLGAYSAYNNSTGNDNIYIGHHSGISTSASKKVIIGSGDALSSSYFDSPDTTNDIQFAVGVRTDSNDSRYWLVGNENFNIGIGTTNPTSKLTVTGDVNISGVVTATTFFGSLTGTATSTTNIPNLTGDVTSVNTVTTLATVNSNVGTFGSSTSIPSITVNAKGLVTGVTTNAITVGDGTLTLNVSGTGLSGSQTFTANQSGNATFTVTSNATSANTASTIVARDASGNFTAGTITATTFSGSGASLTGVPISTGVSGLGANVATFLATPSSANLASAVTDETGSGSLVFATSPSLTTPTLGVASATSINKVTITTPATGSTLTIADGKTLTASNTLTFTGTDASSVAFGSGGTVAYTSNKLSAFSSTTSSELAGVISDETGSGALVFATSPTLTGTVTAANINSSGIVTATQFSTGSGTLGITTNTISGPATITIDPAAVGDNTGTVVIKGDLQIDGTTTTINSTVVTVDDLNITLADGAANAAAANGAGITIAGASATLTYTSTGDKWVFNKDVDAPNFNSTSDANLKENIEIYSNALETLQNLEGVKFTWKETQKPSIGVVAQQIENFVPELVQTGETHKTVNYNGLIGILIEAVKELSEEVKKLKEKN